MAAPKRTKAQLERDRAETAALYLKGWTQTAIADKLGVTQEQIAYDLDVIRKQWLNSTLVDFNEARANELARIDQLERTYWEGYDRSLQERTRSKAQTRTGGQNAGETAEVTTEQRDGSVSWLQGVERCIGLRMKLLGLDTLERAGTGALIKAYGGFDMEKL